MGGSCEFFFFNMEVPIREQWFLQDLEKFSDLMVRLLSF